MLMRLQHSPTTCLKVLPQRRLLPLRLRLRLWLLLPRRLRRLQLRHLPLQAASRRTLCSACQRSHLQ